MATKKKVYGNTTDLSNARTTMGDGYDYVDTSVQGYQAPTDYNDSIVVGGAGAVGGVANNGTGVRLAGANRAETLSAMQKYIDAQKNQTVPQFNSQEYIDGVTTPGNTGIDEAQKSRDAIIDARLQEQTSLQGEQERTVEDNLAKTTETIQGNTYDAQETQKANGVQRGIQYSQQQQALEQGISRAGTKMIVDAGKERDTAILNIRDRISALKNTASLEKQASASQASSEKSNLLAQTTDTATKRQWSIDDMSATQAREDAVIQKNFDNQIKIMDIDQKNKVALQNLDFEHQKVFMALDHAQQTKIAQMNNSAQMSQTLAQISAQKSIASANRSAQQQSDASAERQKQIEVAGNFMLNDPKFNTLNNADKARYFDLIGMPKDIQAKVFAQPPKSESALGLISKYVVGNK